MGNRLIIKRASSLPIAGNDLVTIVSAASRRVRLIEVAVAGNGTTSAMQMLEVGRSSTGSASAVGASSLTVGKFDHSDQPAQVSSYFTTWTTQPTLDSMSEVIGFNALGGANRWIPPKGSGLEIRNGELMSFRCQAGTTPQSMSLSVIVEED